MSELSKKSLNAPESSPRGHRQEHVGIVVPCKLDEFGEFLTGLLAKPQTVIGEQEGVFDIKTKDISNVFHLVEQRVKKQNEGTLANFEIKTTYDNGTSISHETVEAFEAYYPTLPGKPEEIVVSFTWLIKFQRSQVPEKQVIEFVFNTSPNKKESRTKWYAGGLIEWRIKHTERTWASDMNGLLKNHAAHCVDTNSGVWKWLTRYYEELIYHFGLIVIFGVLGKWLFSTLSFLDKSPSHLQLAKYYTVSFVVLFVLYLFLSSVVRGVTVYLVVKRNSYICLINKDEEYKTKDLKKTFRRLIVYFISFAVAVASSIIATVIYESQWAKGLI